uniref:RxLR effector protein n=1 Tax=Peronospora matthiolae TaxID=2874970 RepID=A0AAV1UMV1_9STRA
MRIYVTGLAATAAFLAYSKSSSEVSAFSTTVAAHSPSATVTDTDDTVAKRRLRTFGVMDGEERVNLAGQIMEVGAKSSNAFGKDGTIKLFGQVIEANAKRPGAAAEDAAEDMIKLFGQRISKTGAKRSGPIAEQPQKLDPASIIAYYRARGEDVPIDVAFAVALRAVNDVEKKTKEKFPDLTRLALTSYVSTLVSRSKSQDEAFKVLEKVVGPDEAKKLLATIGLKRREQATTSTDKRAKRARSS